MNNENNNGTVLGGVNPNPVQNPMPDNGAGNLESVVNPSPEINNVGNASGMPTSEPINPTPVTPEPMPDPVMTPNMSTSPVMNDGTLNSTPNPNVDPMAGQSLGQATDMSSQPQVAPQPVGPQQTPVQPGMPNGSVPPVTPGAQGAPVGPEPAYTNPQTINQNTIGTTPPISYEPEKKPKSKNNKILFIIIIVLVLAVVGFGTFYVLKYTNILNKSSNEVTITTKNLEFDKGIALSSNIADYAVIRGTNLTNCNLDTGNVDPNTPGVYEYTVTCGETHRTGKITIIDNTKLIVNLSDVYKVKDEELKAEEFAEVGNNNYTYEFVDSSEVEKYLSSNPGTYTIKIRVTDNSLKKSTEVDGNLIILSNPLKGFLTCTSKEQNVENSNAKMVVNEKFAILDGGTVANAYGNVTYEIYEFTYSDEQEFTNLLQEYNNNGTITINNISGTTVFDEANKKITITNLRKNEEVIAEYGVDNLQSYNTIKKYFSGDSATNTQGLGYECNYAKKQ